MAFTNEQLIELEEAYASGATTVRHGDKTIVYGSLEELWKAILRLRQALASKSKRFVVGKAGYSKYN